jgi:hypothetical protein
VGAHYLLNFLYAHIARTDASKTALRLTGVSMAQRALRFGITDGAGRRAATWKLWTETSVRKSDVYLACRSLGGTLKASLHESGDWHIAYTQQAFERYVREAIPKFEDRFIEKWRRPNDIFPGFTLGLRIVTPWSAITNPIRGSNTKNVKWLFNAPEPRAIEIDIILTAPGTPVMSWPGQRTMGTLLIGSISLANRETVWAVYRVIGMPDFSSLGSGTLYFFKGRSARDLNSEGLRGLIFGTQPDCSRVICDCVPER